MMLKKVLKNNVIYILFGLLMIFLLLVDTAGYNIKIQYGETPEYGHSAPPVSGVMVTSKDTGVVSEEEVANDRYYYGTIASSQWTSITVAMQFGDKAAKFADNVLKIDRTRSSWKLFQMMRTFLLVCFGRILFKSTTFSGALTIYKDMFTHFNPWIFFDDTLFTYGLSSKQFHVLIYSILVLVVVSILQEIYQGAGTSLRQKIFKQNYLFRSILFVVAVFVVIIFGMYGPEYSAGDFIYMKY